MGLLLTEIIASSRKKLVELVDDLLSEAGPAIYQRVDLRLSRPIAKAEMTEMLTKDAPAEIASQRVREVSQIDGVKYIMEDDSWLLIRPSGTEPVLRVYAEARSEQVMSELIEFGHKIIQKVV